MRPLLAVLVLLAGMAMVPWTTPAAAEDMARTRYAELAREDKDLNVTYRQLMARLGPAGRQRLTRSELAWIAFRDAQRRAEADRYRGGTSASAAAIACDIRQTRLRTKDLKAWLKQLAGPSLAPTDRATRERALSQQKGAHAQAEHLLDVAYKAHLARRDQPGRQLMAAAQRAWLTFRDREGVFGAALPGRGDAALAGQTALTWLTGSRAEDLQALADGWKK